MGCHRGVTMDDAESLWSTLPQDILDLLDEPLRGAGFWPSWTSTGLRHPWLDFADWPTVTKFVRPADCGAKGRYGYVKICFDGEKDRAMLVREINEIKNEIITRRLLGE